MLSQKEVNITTYKKQPAIDGQGMFGPLKTKGQHARSGLLRQIKHNATTSSYSKIPVLGDGEITKSMSGLRDDPYSSVKNLKYVLKPSKL